MSLSGDRFPSPGYLNMTSPIEDGGITHTFSLNINIPEKPEKKRSDSLTLMIINEGITIDECSESTSSLYTFQDIEIGDSFPYEKTINFTITGKTGEIPFLCFLIIEEGNYIGMTSHDSLIVPLNFY